MTNPARRRLLARAMMLAAGVAGGGAWFGRRAFAADAAARTIEIDVRRFRFSPAEIVVRRDEAVILAFSSRDFVHGFNLPDFKIRADLLPGLVTRVPLQATQVGRFGFLCDNFCGDGHEEMSGVLIVEA